VFEFCEKNYSILESNFLRATMCSNHCLPTAWRRRGCRGQHNIWYVWTCLIRHQTDWHPGDPPTQWHPPTQPHTKTEHDWLTLTHSKPTTRSYVNVVITDTKLQSPDSDRQILSQKSSYCPLSSSSSSYRAGHASLCVLLPLENLLWVKLRDYAISRVNPNPRQVFRVWVVKMW
jgi:hypothetical protein